jgi:hypothetical protein
LEDGETLDIHEGDCFKRPAARLILAVLHWAEHNGSARLERPRNAKASASPEGS